MTKMLRTVILFAAALAGLLFVQCAPRLSGPAKVPKVYVLPSERLLLRIQPFDSLVKAEIARGGLNAAQVEEDFKTELRYRFSLRRQEFALDSAGAQVILSIAVQHLQPGAGGVGAFGRLTAQTQREDFVQRAAWEWHQSARANVEPAYLARHTVQTVADQVTEKVLSKKIRPREPPPPLILMH